MLEISNSTSKLYRVKKRKLLKDTYDTIFELLTLSDNRIMKINLTFLMKTEKQFKTILNTLNVEYGDVMSSSICENNQDSLNKTSQKN